ncbi:hypothetical protein BDN72DRAFT_901721 [Pluteus cervinus]|uniref:Uncharacterized protein n=1 Tax=Pluteus cervinus TaxID=181527 RepID=A0ACD3AF56_9AGAR|nr:hypothetical protein BDN72DRAFT_901721 [Pluteus cervinus]
MNRLRKPRPQVEPGTSTSPKGQITLRAPFSPKKIKPLSGYTGQADSDNNGESMRPPVIGADPLHDVHGVVLHPIYQPQTPGEHYWAARALKAEAVLATHAAYRHELRNVASLEEEKRRKDMVMFSEHHRERHNALERIGWGLILCILAFGVIFAYTSQRQPPPKGGWRPTHFTIPILSPFASVVENETSVIGSKTLIACFIAFLCMVYFLIRKRYLQ